VFPKGDRLTVGVIGSRTAGPRVRAYFEAFVAVAGHGPARRRARRRSPHPGAHAVVAAAPGRVLVAGRRAGLLEPWTREGISFALRSGALAGAAAAGDPGPTRAPSSRSSGRSSTAGRRALAAFTRHPRAVHEVLRHGPGMWPRFVRLVSGTTTMPEQLGHRPVRLLVSALGG
jgi:flavin-dependent dehydrogenase